MKKILVIAVATLCCIAASAQTIEIGYAGMSTKSSASVFGVTGSTNTNLTGFVIGANIDLNMADIFYLTPGVNFYGYFSEENGSNSAFLASIPLHLKYKFPIGGNDFFLSAGPEFVYGISNKTTSGNTTIDWYNDLGYKRFNIDGGIRAGFDFLGKFRMFAGYTFPFTNEYDSDNITVKSNVFTVGFGFTF